MGIPYGTQYTATVRASKVNETECENCGAAYVYQIERAHSASGTSILWLDNRGAKERASQEAYSGLEAAFADAVDPVACPGCGWFQANMCQLLKRRRLMIALWVSLPTAVILLIWGIAVRDNPFGNSPTLLKVSLGVAIGGSLVGLMWSMLHNPNRAHPGKGATNSKAAAKTKGISKAEIKAAQSKERKDWEERFHRYLLQSMIHMSAIDGSMANSELESISAIYQKVTGDDLPPERLRREARDLAGNKNELLANLNSFSRKLTDEAKDLYVRAGFLIAAADGKFENSEWRLLLELAQAVGMTQPRFDAIRESLKATK